MANINRKSVGYSYPKAAVRETDNPAAGLPRTTAQGSIIKGTTTIEIDVVAGKSNNGVSVVSTKLKQITLYVSHSNRPFGDRQLVFTLPLPALSAVATTPYFGDVNAYIAAQILAGGNDLATLDTAGFAFHYTGNADAGTYRITIPGNEVDELTLGYAAIDDALNIIPVGTKVEIYYQVQAIQGSDTFYYGDIANVLDIPRKLVYVSPSSLDLDDDGAAEDVVILASAADTDDALDYAVAVKNVTDGQLKSLIDVANIATSGYQGVDVGGSKAGNTATGLANDGTAYTASVVVDGGASQPISVVGSAAQTYTTLLAEINTDLTGAVASIVNGNLRIVSDSTGEDSTVVITTGTVFTTLTGYVGLKNPVSGTEGVDAGTDQVEAAQATSIGAFVVADLPRPGNGGPVIVVATQTAAPTDDGVEGEIRAVKTGGGAVHLFLFIDGTWSQFDTAVM